MEAAARTYHQVAAQSRRDQLILEYLSLVRHVLGKLLVHLPSGVDTENLESAGILGLVEAANNFDPTRGVEFKTYAYIRVRGAILDELRRNCPLPQHVLQRLAKVRQAYEELQPPVTIEDLARATGLTRDQVLDCLDAIRLTRIEPWDESSAVIASISDRQVECPSEAVEREELKQMLAEAIMALPERERLAITLYYMEDMRLKEIGKVLGLSESRVSRLVSAAQFQIGEYIRAKEQP